MKILKKEKILVIGGSGHSKSIIDIIIKNDTYDILGIIDSYKPIGEKVFGFPIIGTEEDIKDLMNSHDIAGCVIGIGDNWSRKLMKDFILEKTPSLKILSVVHPSAILAFDTHIPDGTVLMAGAIININAKIGEYCIINTNSSLGHDSVMQDFSSLASGVTIGGNVDIGYCSAVSLGASVIQNISIGKYTVIGAGSLVLDDVESHVLAYGIPAKKIRSRKCNDKYLSK